MNSTTSSSWVDQLTAIGQSAINLYGQYQQGQVQNAQAVAARQTIVAGGNATATNMGWFVPALLAVGLFVVVRMVKK